MNSTKKEIPEFIVACVVKRFEPDTSQLQPTTFNVAVKVLLWCFRNPVYVKVKTAPFWFITQWVLVISYRRFGTDSLETSVRNYHHSLSNKPEERSSHSLRGGSLKSRKGDCVGIGCSKKISKHYNNNSGFDNFGIVCRLLRSVK
jgi:hypothetical protein